VGDWVWVVAKDGVLLWAGDYVRSNGAMNPPQLACNMGITWKCRLLRVVDRSLKILWFICYCLPRIETLDFPASVTLSHGPFRVLWRVGLEVAGV
jgi:hypothetical protein